MLIKEVDDITFSILYQELKELLGYFLQKYSDKQVEVP